MTYSARLATRHATITEFHFTRTLARHYDGRGACDTLSAASTHVDYITAPTPPMVKAAPGKGRLIYTPRLEYQRFLGSYAIVAATGEARRLGSGAGFRQSGHSPCCFECLS